MNHIKRLQKENEILKQGLEDVLSYVQSPKFWTDQSVNTADIILRIQEVQTKLFQEVE
jgi:hypothetical protein